MSEHFVINLCNKIFDFIILYNFQRCVIQPIDSKITWFTFEQTCIMVYGFTAHIS